MKLLFIIGAVLCLFCGSEAVLQNLPVNGVLNNVDLLKIANCVKLLDSILDLPLLNLLFSRSKFTKDDRLQFCLRETKKIEKINENSKKNGHGYKTETNANVFFDPKEQKKRTGFRPHDKKPKKMRRSLESELEKTLQPPFYDDNYEEWDYMRVSRNTKSVPKTVNISYQQNLGPADDQGLCACCYAYTSTALVANFLYMTNKQKYSLSEQELVDCSARPKFPELSNMGCEYGHFDECAIYLNDKRGINLKADYPYVGYEQSSCQAVEKKKVLKDYFVEYVPLDSEYEAYQALAKGNLVATAVCANDHVRYYKSGVLNGPACECSDDCPNHAVVIVGLGYDTKLGMHYWTVRNSWGTTYGDNGHFKIRAFSNCACIGWDLGHFKFTKRA
ncbi:procathepsin L-like [Culicoides brevitarsis]|uniref:procathepsin L-like n=1 Tax=Culicoides brevitarsis TaxID=469753 RepID=UPI00307C830C